LHQIQGIEYCFFTVGYGFSFGASLLNVTMNRLGVFVPGRLQSIVFHHRKVYIDYAHTPCALEKSLSALRPYTKGRLIVLFGCGGNRDPLKRKEMGRVACAHADHVIITDDNPRYEDPQSIHRDIQQGCPKGKAIPDRKKAILYALNLMQANDTLLIAGKGHEATQNIQGRIVELSDQAVVESILNLSRPSNR
jgi:UDP-N-acetylmuramoyl-L-alanyl-D-glutamate--2,6-diaminopimelate ligase